MASNFATLSLVLIAVILVMDFIIWFPFIKAYDQIKLKEEATLATEGAGAIHEAEVESAAVTEATETVPVQSAEDIAATREQTNVLVVCAGGGTSGILANSLNKVAKEKGINLEATARAYGQDMDLIRDMDIVILAPQMDAMKGEMRKITDQYGAVLMTTTGREYIALTRDGERAMALIFEKIKK